MKTKILNIILIFFFTLGFSQSGNIGINTSDPQATLDVNGTVKIRQTPISSTISGYQVLALNQNIGGDFQVVQMNPQIIADFIIDQVDNKVNSTLFSAKKTGGISLLNLSLLSNWKPIAFAPVDRVLGNIALLSSSDNSYIVPSTGVYLIGFYFRYGSGIQSTLFSGGTPGIGILKNTAGNISVLETRDFNGISLAGLANITLSESNINSIYSLQTGDKIYFGISNSGLLSAGILNLSNSSFFIYKISN